MDTARRYWVQPVDRQMTCDCQDYRQRGGPCKHALAVEMFTTCERRDAEQSDPTTEPTNVVPFPEQPAYSDSDRAAGESSPLA